VFLQQEVGKAAQTFLDFPPMQKGGSFNLQAVKEELDRRMASHASQ
jgi:arylsulfatase